MKFSNSLLLKTMPKIELNLHLEGAIPFNALLKVINKYSTENEKE